MSVNLTPRMRSWIEHLGLHIALADGRAVPTVIVEDKCFVSGHTIRVPLSRAQAVQAKGCLHENRNFAAAPGKLGAVRAPYQFKGIGRLEREDLILEVSKIYCTRPGSESGIRMDILGQEKMRAFEEARWKDIEPPGIQKEP